jgi:hypothetical protein
LILLVIVLFIHLPLFRAGAQGIPIDSRDFTHNNWV